MLITGIRIFLSLSQVHLYKKFLKIIIFDLYSLTKLITHMFIFMYVTLKISSVRVWQFPGTTQIFLIYCT